MRRSTVMPEHDQEETKKQIWVNIKNIECVYLSAERPEDILGKFTWTITWFPFKLTIDFRNEKETTNPSVLKVRGRGYVCKPAKHSSMRKTHGRPVCILWRQNHKLFDNNRADNN